MKTENDTLSPQQSLDLITAMINQAKGNVRNNSFFFLFWGWVIVIAHIGSFSLQQIDFDYPYAVWLVIPFAWIVTVVYSIRQARKTKSTTHIDKINSAVWISFGIVAFTIPFIGHYVNYQIDALILLAGSIATTTSGVILKFKPLIIGGVVIYASGIICLVIPIEFRPLVAATAIAIGYLLPGYLLKRQA
ncbi:MAG: hypothetical protein ACKO96_17040 [Flammeovirgaceae bacterium]